MASVEKFKLVGGRLEAIIKHCDRRYSNPGNECIDLNRSEYNYNFVLRDIRPVEYYRKRLDQIWKIKRNDVVGMAGWIVTVPQGVQPEHYQDFFTQVHEFLINRYCHGSEENCIQSVVHMDETTPHLHFNFIPTRFEKNQKHIDAGYTERLDASRVLNRHDLLNFHPALQNAVKDIPGARGVISGITREQGGNRTVAELKRETREREAQERTRWR